MNSILYEKICEANLKEFGNGTKHLKMLSEQLYADDSHFLFEILQNAEDAGATKIEFALFPHKLDIYHNGREFSEDDVRAVTQFAQSTKNDLTQIGKFGLGFKSVHAITEIPEIHSNKFHFCIKHYIRPQEIKSKPIGIWTTLFSLPFRAEKINSIYDELTNKLRNFDTRCLLFLKNLKHIQYTIDGEHGDYKSECKSFIGGLLDVSLINGENRQDFIIAQKAEGDRKIALAFACSTSDKGKNIVKAQDTKLFVWFPTEKETNLHFLLNGNFITTASRENIPENTEHNKALLDLASELLAETLPQIKAVGLCNLSFLQSLPIETEKFPEGNFFYPLFSKVKDLLNEEEYLPTAIRNYTKAKNAAIARAVKLIDLYQPEGKTWLSSAITHDKTPILLEYLEKTLEVDIITPESFARKIDETFLQKQSDEWFINFYTFLNDQKALWREEGGLGRNRYPAGVLRSKPIIRLQDNSLCLPKTAFLPIETTITYPMAKKLLTENTEALAFLKNLGLHKPDAVDYISKTILPKYRQSPNVNEEVYKQDLQHILAVLNGDSYDAISKLKEQLSKLDLIKCEDGIFRKAEEVYCPSELLKSWFKYSSNIHFAGNMLSAEDWEKLDVMSFPNIKTLSSHNNFLVLDGMEDFIPHIEDDNNILTLRDILLICPPNPILMADRLTAKEDNKSYGNAIRYILLQNAWVLGQDGQLYKPADITKDDIAESIKALAQLPFEFKTNRERDLEEELAKQGKMIVDRDRYNQLIAWEAQQAEAKKLQEENWIPETEPDNAEATESFLTPIPKQESTPRIRHSRNEDSIGSLSEEYPDLPKLSPKKAKAVGEWSEKAVRQFLMTDEGYTNEEVKILNENGCIGTGRDIEVRRNGKQEKIIEVKSTESLSGGTFKVSGHQWEVARREGDLYWIYILFGAGSKNPEIVKIQNPIKKWKDGELQAHPVNFIIHR